MHKIQYPTFDFHFDFEIKDTTEAQNQALDWAKRLFLPVIERVLDEFESKGVTIRIEKINLDLGSFVIDNIEDNAPEKLRKALIDAIMDKFSQRQFNVTTDALEEITDSENIFELLVHYLSSGRGSWRSGNFSKELEDFLALQNINFQKKEKKVSVGSLGEPTGTLAHIFDFENFLEVVRQTEPEMLAIWFEEFGQDANIQKRLARQIKAEILWTWIGGANAITPTFLQNMYEVLQNLNKYTWKIPEARIKSTFSEIILNVWAKKTAINDINEIENIFFNFLKKFDATYDYQTFFEKYKAKILFFLNNYTNQNILYKKIKENYYDFIETKKEALLNTSIELSYFTKQTNIIENYLKNILFIFQEKDEFFTNQIKEIIINFLRDNNYSLFKHEDLVKNTFINIINFYKKFILNKYKNNKSTNFVSIIFDVISKDLEKQLLLKNIDKKEIKNIHQIYSIKDIKSKIKEIKNKTENDRNDFDKFIIKVNENSKKITFLERTASGRQGKLPEKKLIDLIKEIEAQYADDILTFIRELSSKYIWAKVSANIFKQKIWETVAKYLIDNQYTAFDFDKFVKTVLVEIQAHYGITDNEIEIIKKQIKIKEVQNLTSQNTSISIEEWRDIWKKASYWEVVKEKIYTENDQLINESYILRIAFGKYDTKILKLAIKITHELANIGITLSYSEILSLWIEYRWLEKENTFNFQKSALNLIEIVIQYKNIFEKIDDNFIKNIAIQAKLAQNDTNYLEEIYLQNKQNISKESSNIFLNTIQEKSVTEIIQYVAYHVPSKINWLKKIITQIYENFIDSSNTNQEDFEKIIWILVANFVLLKKQPITESNILKHIYIELKKEGLENIQLFDDAIKEEELQKKYLLKMLIHFIKTGEWLWTTLISAEKDKNISTILSSILNDDVLKDRFLNLALSIDDERLAIFTTYVLEKNQEDRNPYIEFLTKLAKEKEKNVKDYFIFLQHILPITKKHKEIDIFYKKIFNAFVEKNKKNPEINNLIANLEIDSSHKNDIFEKEEKQSIWKNFYTGDFPDTFAQESLEKQAQILVKFIDTASKILMLLADFFPKSESHQYIPQNIFNTLNISNLTEVLRLYFPDILLIWLNSLPTQLTEVVGKENKKVIEYWEKQQKIFGKDIQDITEKIKNQTYLPAENPKNTQKSKEELKMLAQKLDKATKQWKDEPLYIQNAGMVIIHPFLMRLFDMMKLTENNQFKTEWEASKAVYMLEYLVRKEYEEIDEANLILNKILCGIPIETPLWKEIKLTEQEKELGETLLQAIIQNWGVLGKASPDALRYGFLQREGRLTPEGESWRLRVEQKGMDILVERLPWTLSMIKNPLMKGFIYTEWT